MTSRGWFPGPRFVLSTDVHVSIDGFLPDPLSEADRYRNPWLGDAEPISALIDSACAVFLAEAGSGKTFELERWRLAQQENGEETAFVSLAALGDQRLADTLRGMPEVQAWHAGDSTLVLFLDALDEAPIGPDAAARELERFLATVPRERLKLRLTSRPAAWSPRLAKSLVREWGDDVAVVRLLPLRREDVRAAVDQQGVGNLPPVDVDAFVEAIEKSSAESLAAHPVGLELLVHLFARTGRLADSRAALFERGLETLLADHEDKGDGQGLEARQRLLTAEVLATASVLSNRPFLARRPKMAPDVSTVRPEDLLLRPPLVEEDGAYRIEIELSGIREVLGAGVFSARDDDRVIWSCRTHAEFLSARYLLRHRASASLLEELLVNSAAGRDEIPGQLRGLVGWCATLVPEAWNWLVGREPRGVLQSDLTMRTPDEKRMLVQRYLDGLDGWVGRAEYLDTDRPGRDDLAALRCDGLADLLGPYVRDDEPPAHSVMARRVAADIAGACEVVDLIPDLSEAVLSIVANDPSERSVRRSRAGALLALWRDADLGEDARTELAAALRAILALSDDADPDANLRGLALYALYPDQPRGVAGELDDEELLPHLAAGRRPNHAGAMESFLIGPFVSRFSVRRPAEALAFARERARDGDLWFQQVLARIAEGLGSNLDNPEVLLELLRLEADPYAMSQVPASVGVALVAPGRLKMITGFLASPDVIPEREFRQLSGALRRWSAPPSLIRVTAIELLEDGGRAGKDERERAARLFSDWTDWGDPDDVAGLFLAAEAHPELGELLAPHKQKHGPTATAFADSVRKVREEWAKDTRDEEAEPLSPSRAKRVGDALDRSESAVTVEDTENGFWALINTLAIEEGQRRYSIPWGQPLTSWPGWASASEEDRERIVSAALRYVQEADPRDDLWLGRDTERKTAWAWMGVVALDLVEEAAPERLEAETSGHPATLAKWVPAVVDNAFILSDSERRAALAKRLRPFAGRAAAVTLLAKLDADDPRTAFNEAKDWWSSEVESALAERVTEESTSNRLRMLLYELLQHGNARARAEVEERVARASDSPEDFELAAVAAVAQLQSGDVAVASVLDALEATPELAERVLLGLGEGVLLSDHVAANWSPRDAARFAALLYRQFPPETDPRYEGTHGVGPREQAGYLRDRTLWSLKHRAGSLNGDEAIKAVEAIEWLVRECPEWDGAAWSVVEAREAAGMATWQPQPPAEILGLIRSGQAMAYDRARNYDVFVSHSSDVTATARILASELRSRGVRPFLAVEEGTVLAGAQFPQVIRGALEASRIVVVLVSQGTDDSRWQGDEITRAVTRAQQGLGPHSVVTVVGEKVDLSALPFGLAGSQCVEWLGWEKDRTGAVAEDIRVALGVLRD